MAAKILWAKCWLFLSIVISSYIVTPTLGQPIMELGLCFSLSSYTEEGLRQPLPVSNLKELGTAIKAIQDINNSNGTLVSALDGFQARCPVTFSYHVLDTVSSFSATIRQYNNLKETQGLPQAIIGPSRSSSTIPLSFVSGADNVPIVGFSATSTELDDKVSHEYFSRVIPSDQALSKALIGLLLNYNYPRAGVLYVDDSYGRSIKEELIGFADIKGIELNLFPFEISDSGAIESALNRLSESKLNVVIAVVFDEDIEEVLTKSIEKDLVGPEKLWIFTESVSVTIGTQLASESDEYAQALKGSLQVISKGKVTEESDRFDANFGSFDVVDELRLNVPGGSASIENFNDPIMFNISDDLMESGSTEFTPFVYDAVVSVALAVERDCASFQGQSGPVRIEADRFQELLTNETFEFSGITGDIRFGNLGSRDPTTVDYPVFNFQLVGERDLEIVRVGSFDFETEDWDIESDLLVFSDGSIVAPPFTTVPKEERNEISNVTRIACYTIATIVIFVAFLSALWTYWNRKEHIVRAAQPIFLYSVLLGIICSSVSVFITSMIDEDSTSLLCHTPWYLVSFGFTLVATSLSAKLYRIYRVFDNPKLRIVRITTGFLLRVVVLVLALNVGLLALWTFVVPLEYVRTVVETDEFDQPLVSYGSCKATSSNAWQERGFWLAIAMFHLAQYVVGGVLAYKTRIAPSDFQEGKWISISVFSQAQLVVFGIPVIIAIDEEETELRDLIQTVLILLVNVVLVLLLFVPKIYRQHQGLSDGPLFMQLGVNKRTTEDGIDAASKKTSESSNAGFFAGGREIRKNVFAITRTSREIKKPKIDSPSSKTNPMYDLNSRVPSPNRLSIESMSSTV